MSNHRGFDNWKRWYFCQKKIWAKVEPFHMDTIVEHTTGQIMSMEFDEKRLIKHLRRHYN